jgi:hypothetical protein
MAATPAVVTLTITAASSQAAGELPKIGASRRFGMATHGLSPDRLTIRRQRKTKRLSSD